MPGPSFFHEETASGWRGCVIQSLLLQPCHERALELVVGLPENLWHYGPALAGSHKVPHRQGCRLTPVRVGRMAVVGHKMEIAAAKGDPALLDFIVAHKGLTEAGV